MVEKKTISVYACNDQGYYLHPWALTDIGVLLAVPPFVHVTTEDAPVDLWHTVIELLQKAGARVPHPTEAELDEPIPVFRMAGCRNEKSFAKKSVLCSVDLVEGRLLITPKQWDGKGYEGMRTAAVALPKDVDAQTGMDTLLQAFQIARASC